MAEKRDEGWIALQGAAIVLSILLAFGIEAWWEARQEQRMAATLLHALKQDVERLEQQLIIDKEFNEGILKATVTLLRASTSGTEPDPGIDTLISQFIWFNGGADFNSSPLEALLADGLIELIDDPELRLALIGLDTQLRGIRAFYANDEDFYHSTVVPFLIENAFMAEVTQVARHPVDPTFEYGYPDLDLKSTRSNSHLLKNHRFENLLIFKIDRIIDTKIYAFPALEVELARVSSLLSVNE